MVPSMQLKVALTLTANGRVFVRDVCDVAFEEEVTMELLSLAIVLVFILSSTAWLGWPHPRMQRSCCRRTLH